VLIRNARLWPSRDRLAGTVPVTDIPITDVQFTGGTITEVAPGLRPSPGDDGFPSSGSPGDTVIDAEGAALLPGLHDHHIHLRALAAARASIPAGPPQVRTGAELAARLKAADAELASAHAATGTWLRCTGYHESVAGPLDRHALDRLVPGRPVRVQHRTGALWIVNSVAARALRLDECDLPGVERDADGAATGRLWRLDRWLAERVPSAPPDLKAVSTAAAALGVTGFTDATPGATRRDIDTLAEAAADGTIVQRLHCMAPPDVAPPDMALLPDGRVTVGPVKILLDDDTLPSLDELTDRVRRCHAAGRPVAVHCVTRIQLILTLTALDEAGRHPGDRIEHGAIIPAETIPALGGLTVVTQPHFAAERADQYAADVDPADMPDLWRLRSLLDAGIKVAAGSDAPFGGADPWQAAAAAARRPRFSRTDEAVSPALALSLFFGNAAAPATPRQIAPANPPTSSSSASPRLRRSAPWTRARSRAWWPRP
jgi:predicted amidohydrolase YtcJ